MDRLVSEKGGGRFASAIFEEELGEVQKIVGTGRDFRKLKGPFFGVGVL